ncbi:MAG: glutamine--tRNA ligase, partial [Spirochaetaceae bacterium]|nr:glutamine--tRNA ligase [Spirochaetaceae bacterium]
HIYIEKEDFMVDPPKKYFRLSPGGEIRLKHAYYVKCVDYKKDEAGNVIEVICEYDPKSKGGWTEDGRKVKGTSHWVSASEAIKIEVRLYNNLFLKEDPEEDGDFIKNLNKDSLEILSSALAEPSLADITPDERFQFLRQGYFCLDSKESSKEKPVFNRSVTLKDSFKM